MKQQVELQTLEDELKGFQTRYTGAYKTVDKRFEKLPCLIAELKSSIRHTIENRDFDSAAGVVQVSEAVQRSVFIAPAFHPLFSTGFGPVEGGAEALNAEIQLLAHDAGVPFPEQVDAATLRHTYILHLVRQGVRLRELEHIIGPLPAQTLMGHTPLAERCRKAAGRPGADPPTGLQCSQIGRPR